MVRRQESKWRERIHKCYIAEGYGGKDMDSGKGSNRCRT
jgi:hypothetical protein